MCVQILRWGESQGATDCCSWWSPHTSDGPITWLWHFCPLSSKPTWTSLVRFKTKPNCPPRLDSWHWLGARLLAAAARSLCERSRANCSSQEWRGGGWTWQPGGSAALKTTTPASSLRSLLQSKSSNVCSVWNGSVLEGELACKVQYLQLSGITHDPAAPVPSNMLLFVLTPTQELIKNENELSEAGVNFSNSRFRRLYFLYEPWLEVDKGDSGYSVSIWDRTLAGHVMVDLCTGGAMRAEILSSWSLVMGQPTPVLHSHHEGINQVVTEKRKKPKLISSLDFIIPVLQFGSPYWSFQFYQFRHWEVEWRPSSCCHYELLCPQVWHSQYS